jgi:hypothetical protein
MKKIFTLIVIALISITANAQKNFPDVILKLNHLLNENTFSKSTTGTNNIDNQFNVSRLEYYISDIVLTHDGGLETKVENYYILVNANSPGDYNLGTFEIDKMEAITFSIGVPSNVNNADPTQWSAGHPLAPRSPSMHWGWASGYRFVALEGKAGASLGTTYEIHALGNKNYFTQKIPMSVEWTDNIVLEINADYSKALKGIPVANGIVTHGEEDEAAKLLRNFQTTVFSNASGEGNVLSATQITLNEALAVYPNPSNGVVNLSFDDKRFANATVAVTDVTGNEIAAEKMVNLGGKILLETKGVYFVTATTNDGFVARKKVIIQ